MSEEISPVAPVPASPPVVGKKKSGLGCLQIGGIGCLALLLIALGVAIGFFFALRRAPANVHLTQAEKEVVEQKIEFLQDQSVATFVPPPVETPEVDGSSIEPGPVPPEAPSNSVAEIDNWAGVYEEDEEGRRVIHLTEREINGYFTDHPEVGEMLRLQFRNDEIVARIRLEMPADSPFMAGKKVNLRGRVKVIYNDKQMHASIESLTAMGIAVPNAVLGGLKGNNLFDELFDSQEEAQKFRQVVEELTVRNGEITIKLAE